MFPYSYHSQCYLTTRLCTHPTHLRQQDITGELTFTQTVSVIHDHRVNSEITVYEWVQQEVHWIRWDNMNGSTRPDQTASIWQSTHSTNVCVLLLLHLDRNKRQNIPSRSSYVLSPAGHLASLHHQQYISTVTFTGRQQVGFCLNVRRKHAEHRSPPQAPAHFDPSHLDDTFST